MNPDKICGEYSQKKTKILVKELDKDMILIEGDAAGLEFIGKLFISLAKAKDDGFQLSPLGAGKSFFKTGSSKGIYIHRVGDKK